MGAVLALFSTHSYALDQNAVNAQIASIKEKAASGQDVKGDIAELTNKLKADAKSLVVSNQINLSVIDKSGTVSLFVPFPTTTHVIANDEHMADAKAAIAKHPEASKAHDMDKLDATVSLGGGSKKKTTSTNPPAAAPAPTSSSGGIGDLIGAGLSTIVNIGSGLVGGILGAI